MNGLKEVETILLSQAVLIKNQQLALAQQSLLEKLLFRIQSVKKRRITNMYCSTLQTAISKKLSLYYPV